LGNKKERKMKVKLAWILGFIAPVLASANEAVAGVGAGHGYLVPLGVGLGIGIAVFGAASAQGRLAASFMDGVARNPSAINVMRTPLILSLIFVETLVLFSVLIVYLLMGKM